jgi:acyl carrier protein
MNDPIQNQIIKIAADVGQVPVEQVTLDSHFMNDLNFDSLTVVEFTMEVEDTFSVSMPDERMQEMMTVRDVVLYVEEQTSVSQPGES